jgi:N6-L-threonylcarbamoyladenine synthase
MLTLGIESSCDDTSLAVIKDGVTIKASLVSSQIEVHQRFGGVVPEVASRKHLEAFNPLLQTILDRAGATWSDIGQIAVTAGPGLLGSLLIGLSSAKALSLALNLPLIPVNHLEGHLGAAFLAQNRAPAFPYLGMIVSGGHSSLVLCRGLRDFEVIGRTADDAPGELFDKTARFLGLGYPGGPEIQKSGANGDPKRYPLPRPMKNQGLGFSFSGLKTAVMNTARNAGDTLDLPGLCASLQAAVADTVSSKIAAAVDLHRINRLIVAGGVAANSVLRGTLEEMARHKGLELLIPPLSLCTDNAAMIGAVGFFTAHLWEGTDTRLTNARADWPMGGGASSIIPDHLYRHT